MPPRLNFHAATRSLTIRSRPIVAPRNPVFLKYTPRRGYADEAKLPVQGQGEDGLGHVSEEAAEMGDVTGETKPDLGQGTPVSEVCIALNAHIMSMMSTFSS